jgi:hypothetical protein
LLHANYIAKNLPEKLGEGTQLLFLLLSSPKGICFSSLLLLLSLFLSHPPASPTAVDETDVVVEWVCAGGTEVAFILVQRARS